MDDYKVVATMTWPAPEWLDITMIRGIPPKEPIHIDYGDKIDVEFMIAFDGSGETYCTATDYKVVKEE